MSLNKKYGNMNYFQNLFPNYPASSENIIQYKRLATVKSKKYPTKNSTLTLYPNIYDMSTIISNKIFNFNKRMLNTTDGVYSEYYDIKNNSKIGTNITFKTIRDYSNANPAKYKGLVFHYLLQKYYKDNNLTKLNYLCNIREIGKIFKIEKTKQNTNILPPNIYCIMDNCGEKLIKIKDDPVFNGSPLEILKFIVTVFKQCLLAVQLLHNLNYLHLNSTPHNYLFTKDRSGNIQVKIINFENTKKCNTSELSYYGDAKYIPNDWIINATSGRQTQLQKHHDIFELGCTFITLIFYLLREQTFEMCCPIRMNTLMASKNFIPQRMNYNLTQHNDDMGNIFMKLNTIGLNIKLCEIITKNIIYKMVHPNPDKRFQSIEEILPTVDILLKNISFALGERSLPDPKEKTPQVVAPRNTQKRELGSMVQPQTGPSVWELTGDQRTGLQASMQKALGTVTQFNNIFESAAQRAAEKAEKKQRRLAKEEEFYEKRWAEQQAKLQTPPHSGRNVRRSGTGR